MKIERISVIVKKLGWRFHAGLVMFIAVGFAISLYTSIDYYESAMPAAAAIGLLILRFWAVFSKKIWFWIMIVVLTAIQIPLVIASKDLANTYAAPFMFLFAWIDFLVMDYLILKVSPEAVEIVF